MAAALLGIAALHASSLAAVAPPPPPLPTSIWPETLQTAVDARFPYTAHLRAAWAGDRDALRALAQFSRRTDAAASLGHRDALHALWQHLGQAAFDEVRATLPPEDRRHIEWLYRGESPF